MNQTIYEKIQSKGEVAVNDILVKANTEAAIISKNTIDKANKDANDRILRAKNEADKTLAYKKRLFDLEKRQALLTSKQEILDDIFNDVLDKILKFEGKELLAYVSKLIKQESYIGDEIIRVNEASYDKYLKALSTAKSAKLVDADLLNELLKTKFKLSKEPINIKNGFLLEGKDFDLNFSFDQIITNLRIKEEKAIAVELFE